jgi:hypothetical protein
MLDKKNLERNISSNMKEIMLDSPGIFYRVDCPAKIVFLLEDGMRDLSRKRG